MHKTTNNQSGFGIVWVVLIVVVLAVLGVGALVAHKNPSQATLSKSNTSITTTTNSTHPTNTTTDPTANWKRVDSVGGAYSIKAPDGWELTSYPDNTLNADDLTYMVGTPAVITTASSAYAGDQKKFNVVFTDKQYAAPQWQSPSQFATEATADYSVGSLVGKKYSIEYTQSVTGIEKGDKIYQYVFNLANGKQLSVVYMQNAGDTDNLQTVERAIQTIVIK